jgi:hypothetical protein
MTNPRRVAKNQRTIKSREQSQDPSRENRAMEERLAVPLWDADGKPKH